MKTWLRKHPVETAIACWVIGTSVNKIPIWKIIPSYYAVAARQYIIAAFMLAVMVVMGGGDSLKRVLEGAGGILRKSIYFLAVTAVQIAIALIASFSMGNLKTVNIAAGELGLVVLCLSIGLVEETMYRGVLFSGLQKKLGMNRKGLAAAVVLASLIFGFDHVAGDVFAGGLDILSVTQIIGKILTSAVVGMLFAVLYMRYKNIWMIAIVHALNDFLGMQANLVKGVSMEGGYVSAGTSEAAMQTASYFMQLLLFSPIIISCVRMMKEQKAPEYGVFRD